ncbi:ABC-F family ATP-binding cassette domain-containing protein [Entomohabitans teleogrylli]|uniref:ABC-F family ATP-binding cassette domain-containing protein n=1 Tax=Entomohabitans teleogrylli TaxID=1384589 RepID=UPI00073DB2D9|nr:ABC-F family ATP-binding cassette domain-containing protein [Entomohabitans teleogrylli]
MINPSITLEGVSFILPDGRTLFSDLNAQFDARHTGLVGRNGVGKTLLARIMAGSVSPTRGRCICNGKPGWLAQQTTPAADASVASLAGVQPLLDALARIEAGSCASEDFDALGEHWDVRQRLEAQLKNHGLGYLKAETPARTLSGGEAMRVALAGIMLAEVDYLILDEPTNHLDSPSRATLIDWLRGWPGGLLVISHDRQLLDSMDRIVELSATGLRSYGGNYSFYFHTQAQEQQAAWQRLEARKLERQRQEQALRQQSERQARRKARGERHGRQANQAKILLDRQKERSDDSAARLCLRHDAIRERLSREVDAAAQQVAEYAAVNVHGPQVCGGAKRLVAALEAVTLPFIRGPGRQITMSIGGRQRIGIVGPNGCGKSTLLRLLAGQLEPLAGVCHTTPHKVYLDQWLRRLDTTRPLLEQLRALNHTLTESELRMRLAQLGLEAQKIALPVGVLSGGEQLKATLASVLYAEPPPQLLLLDEPNNHLDLPSLQALETMLCRYQGAIVVVSHDACFLDHLQLTDRLLATAQGWRLEPW